MGGALPMPSPFAPWHVAQTREKDACPLAAAALDASSADAENPQLHTRPTTSTSERRCSMFMKPRPMRDENG
jgi:hypothetical protein